MTLLKRITFRFFSDPIISLIFGLFLVAHVLVINVNNVEWGDSYRILRASNYLRSGTYPIDEKRPPLFSALLAVRQSSVDAVTWARVFMIGVSAIAFVLVKIFLEQYVSSKKFVYLGLVFWALNPVYFYWSIRIMADVLFSVLVLAVLIGCKKYFDKPSMLKLLILGLLCGLSVLTRFEGYILSFIVFVWLVSNSKTIHGLTKLIPFVYAAGSLVLPFIIWRNPLISTYFAEPSDRKYDVEMIVVFLLSAVFIFGIVPAWGLIGNYGKQVYKFLEKHLFISLYLFVQLFLCFVWPAAIPRLFVPIIPVLILLLVISLQQYFENKKDKLTVLGSGLALTVLLVLAQMTYHLQFLVVYKTVLLAVVLLQFVGLIGLYLYNFKVFFVATTVGMLLWTASSVYMHKDTLLSVKAASIYTSQNVTGRVVYNDVSSVSGWHLNFSGKNKNVFGYFHDIGDRNNLTFEALSLHNPDYLLLTNEHNPTMEITLDKRPYLKLVKEFSYTTNGTTFTTRLIKFDRNYYK